MSKYRILPLGNDEKGTARCRIFRRGMERAGVGVGEWVRIATRNQHWVCCAWPSSLSEEIVQADLFIKLTTYDDEILDTDACTISLIPSPKPCINVTISIDKERSSDILKKFLDSPGHLQEQILRNILDGLAISSGCTIGSEACESLKIKVHNTIPPSSPAELFLVTKTTRIAVIEETDHAQKNLVSSLRALTLETSTIPGLERAYEALLEVVGYPLVFSHYLQKLNVECPKGVLLHGPPGVGKTYLVTKIAKVCGASLVTLHGPSVYAPHAGESEANLRLKFQQAKDLALRSHAPCILFMDELDALTPQRANAQAHESRVVAQLLTLMDGMESRGQLVVIGATNRPNSIDPALRRPGRFDREVAIEVPGEGTRRRMLKDMLKEIPLNKTNNEGDINIQWLANVTNGYVGADLAAVVREAAMIAVQDHIEDKSKINNCFVTREHFSRALAKIPPSIQRGLQVPVESMSWDDIGGLDQVKKQIQQAVEWPLKFHSTFDRLGLRPPRGVLLYGPPGCSKTTLVKVVANTAGASFFSINGAQLYSPYVGDSEKTIRETFQKARASAPAIIFFDEVDSIVGKRDFNSEGSVGRDSVRERVLSTLLNEMDGVEIASSLLVMGATNRLDMIDDALLRPGRFDRLIYVPLPDTIARLQILRIHTRNVPLKADVDLKVIADKTQNFSGADLRNLCREAAMTVLRDMCVSSEVGMEHFLEALRIITPSISSKDLMVYQHKKYNLPNIASEI
ncbi:uncharacterized protein VTP21DRAFT_7822 [Calcarisporiella thermophila]|uniref:uncharacterized protein n=1 Tax=Calcarisporiella thermophila TaxID=911321 RepID=UPI0037435918